VCQAPLPAAAAAPGRPTIYCSRACQAKAYRARSTSHATPDTSPTTAATALARQLADAADRLAAAINAGNIEASHPVTLQTLTEQLIALAPPPTPPAVLPDHATAPPPSHTVAHPPNPRDETPARVTKTAPPAAATDPGLRADHRDPAHP
jgi:hypothetical protein